VTPDDVMRSAGNLSFWKSHADGIIVGPTPTETEVHLTKPPERRPRSIVSYAVVVVQKQSTKWVSENNQSVDATTTASTISGDSGEPRNDAGIEDLKQKLAEIDTHRDNYAEKQQNVEDDVSTLTESMHNMASDIINIRKDMNGISSQVKELTELLKQQIEIKTSESNFIESPPRQRRRTGNTGLGSVSSNEGTKRTSGSDCDYEMEEAVGKVDQKRVAMDTGGNSG
jgi:prophage DNA circulation protein